MVTVGVIALVVALVAVTLARLGTRSAHATRLACADVPNRRGRAVVSGVVEPLSETLVYAPVSGRSCVWFTSTIVEYWVERDNDRVRDFDGDGPLHHGEIRPARRGRGRTETQSSQRPFLVRDDTGAVRVDPAGLRVGHLPVSVRDSVSGIPSSGGAIAVDFAPGARRMRRSSRLDRTEVVLLPGERVYLTGQITRGRDGTPVLGGRGLTVSRRDPAESARLPQLGARAGWTLGAVAGLIGVAALVAGSARH
ncbi:GIDE domain-containing protein [Streptodolium elevatio]